MQNQGKTALGLDANVASLLCYIPVCLVNLIFSIIVLVTERANRFARFHALQSILLFALYIVVYFVFLFISLAAGIVLGSGIFSSFLSLFLWVIFLAYVGISIFACIKAYQNEMFKFPIIGDLADKWLQ